MFDTICTLPLTADLFTQAIHPHAPLLAVGLSDGHVETLRLPPVPNHSEASNHDPSPPSPNGKGHISSAWRTRRHKGSCRSLAYSIDGGRLFSAGTDGIVKVAESETGRVVDKIRIPGNATTGLNDEPSLLHVLSPQACLLATDSSALHLYDLRVSSSVSNSSIGFEKRKPQQTHYPHTDYISSLSPLPPTEASTSGFSKQWVSTGGTTLAITDVRRGVLVKSEDQEEELLSSVFVSGLSKRGGGTSVGEKVVVGGAGGVLTLWEKGQWDDQDERITVDRSEGGGESLDVLSLLPDGVGPGGKVVAVGTGEGLIRFVKIGANKVIGEVRHDEVEAAVGLGFDVGGRMISGGGNVVKVWHDKVDEDNGAYVDGGSSKRHAGSDSEDEDGEDDGTGKGEDDSDEDSDEEDGGRKRRKKRKRGKGKQLAGKAAFAFSGLD